MTWRILIVEDDLKLARAVRQYLEQQGFEVASEHRGDRAAEAVAASPPDLVILDIMLPGKDGLSVCREIRGSYRGPVIMLTARGEELDEVVGLEVGADDYLAKPVRPRVLLARIRALMRRVEQVAGGVAGRADLGRLVVSATARTAWLDGETLELTSAEFDLLWFMAQHPGEPLSRDRLSVGVRGVPYDGLDRSIDLRISSLRSKLGDDGKRPEIIKSVRGIGYQLVSRGNRGADR